MSATPKTHQRWTGFFGKSGSPAIKITVAGPLTPGQDMEAVIDTGFTGFLSIPLLQALPLGLLLYGTTTIELADGSQGYRLTAKGEVKIGDESRMGVLILEPTSNEVLLGMAFLRQFERALFVSSTEVFLVSENSLKELSDNPSQQAAALPNRPDEGESP